MTQLEINEYGQFTETQLFDFGKKETGDLVTKEISKQPYNMKLALHRACSLEAFINKGEYAAFCKENKILICDDETTFVENKGIIYYLWSYLDDLYAMIHKNNFLKTCPAAIILPENKKIKSGTYFTLLLNADTRDNDVDAPSENIVGYIENIGFPSISFECLRRFYGKAKIQNVCKRLVNGSIELIDYTSDHVLPLTQQEKTMVDQNDKNDKNPLPTKPGYTLIPYAGDMVWHLPSTVIFYDHKYKFTMLLGIDEDSYFGVELADNPKTVQAAYNSLIPKSCRGVDGVKRQGEWFAKPIKESDVPDITECCITIDETRGDCIALNRDNKDSAKHYLFCEEARVKDNTIYAYNATLSHENEEHVDLDLGNRWYTFHRNTAVRSFSVQGVD